MMKPLEKPNDSWRDSILIMGSDPIPKIIYTNFKEEFKDEDSGDQDTERTDK